MPALKKVGKSQSGQDFGVGTE
eukprot:COSAG01_NODE_62236_length_285_cov_1.397849_2_plen_21_part_01